VDFKTLEMCIKETLLRKRMSSLEDRYEVLLLDCLDSYHKAKMEGQVKVEVPGTTRTKTMKEKYKKFKLEQLEKYGAINPVIKVLPNGAVIRSTVTPSLLIEWRRAEEIKLKKMSYEQLVLLEENENIDWAVVSNMMMVSFRKLFQSNFIKFGHIYLGFLSL